MKLLILIHYSWPLTLKSGEVRTNITGKGDVELSMNDVQYAVRVVSAFFSRERVCNLSDICACHFMRMSLECIEEWIADPEIYFLSEEQRTAEENVTMAAQTLFCSLAESSTTCSIVLSRLVALLEDKESQIEAALQEVSTVPYTRDGENTVPVRDSSLLWEAIYTSAGLCASELNDYGNWDFGAWYCKTLDPCLRLLLAKDSGVSVFMTCLVTFPLSSYAF